MSADPKSADPKSTGPTSTDPTSTGPDSLSSRNPTSFGEALTRRWGVKSGSGGDPTETIRSGDSRPSVGTQPTIKVHQLTLAGHAPTTTSDFELLELLGQGGMGVVYRARQAAIDRTIALKMMRREAATDTAARNSFLAEAVATGSLEHPNIVPVHDLGSDANGALFFAMKQVHGRTWREALPVLSLEENLDVLLRVSDAVAFAHSRGVLHRDLKPSNVMIGDFGEVLVLDWGLAVAFEPGSKAQPLDEHCPQGGTPAYLAPEMAGGPITQLGVWSDMYLLGACLWEILTGKPPHQGSDRWDVLVAAVVNDIAPAPGPEGELHAIARQAMATAPAQRHPSVRLFQAAIREALGHRASSRLSDHAAVYLGAGQRAGDYEQLSAARHGFEQALALWSGNQPAVDGIQTARTAHASLALQRSDLDLAATLAAGGTLGDTTLPTRIATAQHDRQRRVRRLQRLTWTAASLAAIVVIGGSIAFREVALARTTAETELTRRLELERQEAEAQALIRRDAQAAIASGEAAAAAAQQAADDNRREEHYIVAQGAFRRALFLVPRDPAAEIGLRTVSVEHAQLARRAANWRQAREKIDQAAQAGLPPAEYDRLRDELTAAATARTTYITGRIAVLMTDAATPTPTVPQELARAELISLADAVTVDLLLARLDDPQIACRLLALEALGWMRDPRIQPALLARLGSRKRPAEEAAAFISLCNQRPAGRATYDNLCARLTLEDRELPNPWQAQVKPAWVTYARTVIEAIAAEDSGTVSPVVTMIHGHTYCEIGEWRKSAEWMQRSIRANSRNAKPFYVRWQCLDRLGEHEEAIACAELMRQAHPRLQVLALSLKGSSQLSAKRLDDAEITLNEALAMDPLDWATLCTRADLHIARKNYVGALADLNVAIPLQPRPLQLHERAKVRLALGDLPGALADLDAFVTLSPTQASALFARAEVRWLADRENGALADLDQGLALDPKQQAMQALRGWWRWQRGDHAGAEADCTAIGNNALPALTALTAERAREAGDLVAAEAAWREALAADPRPIWRLELGRVLSDRGDPAAGVREADRAVTEEPWAWRLLNGQSVLRFAAGDQVGALAAARRAAELAPEQASVQLNLGWILAASGASEAALLAYNKAVMLAPDMAQALVNRSQLLLERKQFAAALVDSDQLLRLARPTASQLLLRGRIFLATGDPQAAVNELTQAAATEPTALPALVLAQRLAGQDSRATMTLLQQVVPDAETALLAEQARLAP